MCLMRKVALITNTCISKLGFLTSTYTLSQTKEKGESRSGNELRRDEVWNKVLTDMAAVQLQSCHLYVEHYTIICQ